MNQTRPWQAATAALLAIVLLQGVTLNRLRMTVQEDHEVLRQMAVSMRRETNNLLRLSRFEYPADAYLSKAAYGLADDVSQLCDLAGAPRDEVPFRTDRVDPVGRTEWLK